MAEKILQVEHLKKSYDGKTNVLDDISFGIEKLILRLIRVILLLLLVLVVVEKVLS